jgi:hypothetical protein
MELRMVSMQDFAIEEQLYQDHLAQERQAGSAKPIGEALFAASLGASWVVGEAVRIITGIAPVTLMNSVMTLSPLNGGAQINKILRVPRCPDCFRGAVAPTAAMKAQG